MFEQTKWVLLAELVYLLVVIAVCIRIVYDTRSVNKTLAYLLLVLFLPVLGIAFYFSFGINYRKRKIYNRKQELSVALKSKFWERIQQSDHPLLSVNDEALIQNRELIRLLYSSKAGNALILPNKEVKILLNGEEMFPQLLKELQNAKDHIHIEYYIYQNDATGNAVKDVLIQKAKEGVEIRFIYDDFGSRRIRKTIVRELKKNNIEALPFNKIRFIRLANRLNYRNHRKIVVIDGITSFTGGINIADKYSNQNDNKLFWRDTHLMIKGYSSLSLQQVFLSDWNFCSKQEIGITNRYFPEMPFVEAAGAKVQITASGPDSDLPNILYSFIQAINLAEKEILLTTPYYIPDNTLQQALIIAALSGVEVKLLVPEEGDSKLVNLAAHSYFEELLEAGVRIFQYQKGFIHAKTLVTDKKLASVGTANLDFRSFDLNFEVAAIIYDTAIASELADIFYKDLEDAEEIKLEAWLKRPLFKQLKEKFLRLLSPLM